MVILTPPIIVVNMKSYLQTTGEKAVHLAKVAERVATKTGVTIALAPQAVDLYRVAKSTTIPIYAQHIDSLRPGVGTGRTLAEAVNSAGAVGTLINHSEHRLTLTEIDSIIQRAREIPLETLVCTNNPQVSAAVAALKPDYIAIEPPELIETGISVSKARPEVVTNAIRAVRQCNKDVILLCGAGITTGEDFRAALELGTSGILLASGVTKATDPAKVLLELAQSVEKKE